jgi:hypothetical protein
MDNIIYLGNKYTGIIFNPYTLQFFNDNSSIIPVKPMFKKNIQNNNNLENFKFFIKTNNNDNTYIKQNIDDISLEDYLLIHFGISKIDDTIPVINLFLQNNYHKNTIETLLNLIFKRFFNILDDEIVIDKFIKFYLLFFEKFYNKVLEYDILFKAIQTETKSTYTDKIHTEIINNILNNE